MAFIIRGRMISWVTVVLFFGVVVTGAMSVMSVRQTLSELVDMRETSRENLPAFVALARHEVERFATALNRYANGDPTINPDRIVTLMDIVWSRVDLVPGSRVGQYFARLPSDAAIIDDTLALLHEVEEDVLGLGPEDRDLARDLYERISPLVEGYHQLMLESIAVQSEMSSDFYAENETDSIKSIFLQTFSLLLSCSLLTMLMVTRRRVVRLNGELESRVESRTQELQSVNSQLQREVTRATFLAQRDVLTGLYNRGVLKADIQALMGADCRRAILCFIDLDNFKKINDSYSHAVGDELLKIAADRLRHAVRHNDLVARIGGDEFIVILQADQYSEVLEASRRIYETLTGPAHVQGLSLHLNASVGVAQYPDDGQDVDTLMRHADLAMFHVKQTGRNGVYAFSQALKQQANIRTLLEQDFAAACEEGRLRVHFQPRICAVSNRILGAEALARWTHPTLGDIPPNEFIPLVEETGLIEELGDRVLREAANQLRRWASAGHRTTLSVNLSPRQLRSDRLMDLIQSVADDLGPLVQRIELEITESILIQDSQEVVDNLAQVRALGYSLSIDDFGTGYSNLAYIPRYPLSCLKIDKSFVDQLPTSAPVIDLILSLARQIGAQAIAEGVETETQRAWLQARGCHQYQGYLFSPALPPNEFERLLRSQQASLPALGSFKAPGNVHLV